MQLIRLGIGFPLAAAITFGLFALMQYLIAGQDGTLIDTIDSASIDFVRVKRDETTQAKDRQLPERAAPKQAPPPPPMNMSDVDTTPDNIASNISMPDMTSDLDLAGFSLNGVQPDSDVIPLVRINPRYPSRALSRGKEGWVQVEFTISRTGTVIDPVIVAADPPKTFNRAALKAIAKWKYKPKLVDGRPEIRPGIQVVLTFKIEK